MRASVELKKKMETNEHVGLKFFRGAARASKSQQTFGFLVNILKSSFLKG